MMTKTTRGTTVLFSVALLAVAALAGFAPAAEAQGLPRVSFNGGCFPTCDENDGRFLVIASGDSLQTLADNPLRLKFGVSPAVAGSTFRIEIFDGDIRGTHWDLRPSNPLDAPVTLYTLYGEVGGIPGALAPVAAGAPARLWFRAATGGRPGAAAPGSRPRRCAAAAAPGTGPRSGAPAAAGRRRPATAIRRSGGSSGATTPWARHR